MGPSTPFPFQGNVQLPMAISAPYLSKALTSLYPFMTLSLTSLRNPSFPNGKVRKWAEIFSGTFYSKSL